jgi:hypothetical protein
MGGRRTPPERFRARVRFYLIDSRTRLGKLIDIVLLGLNVVFIALFVVETYRLSAGQRELLWTAEVAIATVFLIEYFLRLYSARDRRTVHLLAVAIEVEGDAVGIRPEEPPADEHAVVPADGDEPPVEVLHLAGGSRGLLSE